jgi:WD40 repeat protein
MNVFKSSAASCCTAHLISMYRHFRSRPVILHYPKRFLHDSLCVASGCDINWTAVLTVISGHTSFVNSVSFSPEGTCIATGSNDCTVRLWDAEKGQPVGEPFLGHTASVTSVSFSRDGTCIVSGSYDKTVRLWDVATWPAIVEPLLGHTELVNSVAFSLNGTCIVSGSYDKTLRLWDAATQ